MVWYWHMWASLIAQMGKNLPAIRRPGFNPWIGKIPGRRNVKPLQYSFLKRPMDGGAWQATVHGGHKRVTHD